MNIRKYFNTEIKSIDEESKTVEVVFSTEDVDRDGDIVVQAGWDFEEYAKNPIVLWGHNSSEPPVATTLDVRTEGTKSIARMKFAEDDGVAERLWKLIKQGILRTVSAGFINTDRDGEKLLNNTLLEISWVSIPANPNAITLGYESGMIEKSDMDFLAKHYQKQLKDIRGKINPKETKEMKQKEEAELTEAINNAVSEAVKPLAEKLEAVLQAQAEEADAKQTEEVDTKPEETGSTDAEETVSEEEVAQAVAEGVAEALAEV